MMDSMRFFFFNVNIKHRPNYMSNTDNNRHEQRTFIFREATLKSKEKKIDINRLYFAH